MNCFKNLVAVMLAVSLAGCMDPPLQSSGGSPEEFSSPAPESPEGLVIGLLDELEDIADGLPSGRLYGSGNTLVLRKGASDTTFIYGALTADGYGAVVTERHTFPRGIPLITVRSSYGKEGNTIVSEVRRYTSQAALLSKVPEQTVLTEVAGLSRDTILTHVTRNGRIETYTFRLPVETAALASDPESTRRTSRFALNAEILVETRDGNGTFLQRRRHTTLPDGSLITRTEYADGSWRQSRTVGRADGTILHETAASE